MDPEAHSRMRALDWVRAGIKTAQLNDSSRSQNILFSIFSISNGLRLLHIYVRLPVLLCAVKTVEGDFRFCWTTTPNVGQTHKENPNLVRILYMVCTLNDIYTQYNKLHEH